MEDKEFLLCEKKCKSFLKRNRIGKLVNKSLETCLETIFREGYKLGVKETNKMRVKEK